MDDKFALKPATEVAPELKPEALKGLARDGGEPAVITLAGAEKLVKAKRIPGTDWYLVVALDKPRPRWD